MSKYYQGSGQWHHITEIMLFIWVFISLSKNSQKFFEACDFVKMIQIVPQ